MQQTNPSSNISNDDEIDVKELFNILVKGKWLILSSTLIIALIAMIYSLTLPNIYLSKALLAPVDPSSSLTRSMQSYSSIANLAGINIQADDLDSNSAKAMEKLISLSFFENNILPNIFLPELMAVNSYNYKSNLINFDSSKYDANKDKWVRDYSFPMKQVPSAQESHKVFLDQHFIVSKDKVTGYISLTVKHQSPFVAQKWTELIVSEINSFYRKKDKIQTQNAVDYLNKEMALTNFAESKQVIAQLIQQETQKLTLIEVNEDYVFNYIDPPAVSEIKSEPRRSLILLIGLMLGFIFGFIIIIIKHLKDPHN